MITAEITTSAIQPTDRPCADCGVGTDSLGEAYIVHDDIWDQAWANRLRPFAGGILCIGCLETRLGRTLTGHDFTDWPINIPIIEFTSKRLRNRLTAGLTNKDIELRIWIIVNRDSHFTSERLRARFAEARSDAP